MLNPTHQRYAERLRELMAEGQAIIKTQTSSQGPGMYGGTSTHYSIPDKVRLQAWLTSVNTIFDVVFGSSSPQYQQYSKVTEKANIPSVNFYTINIIVGTMRGALDDLEQGFLVGQELLIAAEVFDSVLEQAKHLNDAGYKDSAAVLARVVLEDSLRRLAREASLDDTVKAAVINNSLKTAGKYPQPQWRLIQVWLDIGNAAAHGNFHEYNKDDVEKQINGIELFLATHFAK